MAPMAWATHTIQWCLQSDATAQVGANQQRVPKFGLLPVTREYEAGIASNRESASRGE